MSKIDFKKDLLWYKAKAGRFDLLSLPSINYLMVDGQGDPNTSTDFTQAVALLYPVAYALKFASKRQLGKDYVVPPLEGLWWADDMEVFTSKRNKSKWYWTMMLMVPDWIDSAMVNQISQSVKADKGLAVEHLRLEMLAEGQVVQTLHIGSFDHEGPLLEQMHHQFIPDHHLQLTGKHHEIYLSDFRKVPPDKLKTILRQPVMAKH